MLGRTGVAHYARRCSWAHSEGHIGVAHYGILVGGPLQLRWQPIGRRCLWAHLGEVPTQTTGFQPWFFHCLPTTRKFDIRLTIELPFIVYIK